ncbi:NAD(P)/FAD-dependent oxidoreductase [Roseobacteraceae bacterium S113]
MTQTRITIDTPVTHRDPLPAQADVVIIGGGVIGIFAALYLGRAGQRVVVCEKGRIAGEQSSRNWGWIRQTGRDPDELPIVKRALELWHEVERETGGACGLRAGGTVYLSNDPGEVAGYEAFVALAARHDVDSRLLEGPAVGALFGGGGPGWAHALITPTDARAEPWQAVPAVARLARDCGVVLREDCAVRALDVAGGAVRGVVTEDGAIACDQVILAAGAWSSLFARRHGISIPQLSVRATVAQTEPLPQVFDGNAADDALAFRRRADGGYSLAPTDGHSRYYLGPDGLRHARKYLPVMKTAWRTTQYGAAQPSGYPDGWRTPRQWDEDEVSPFERMRVLEPAPDQASVARLAPKLKARFPEIGMPRIKTAWAGMIDAMPDVVPIVDRVPGTDGLIIATGMSGHGFGIGPGIGEILTRMVMGEAPGYDMHRFRFSRFSDGSRMRPGPGL